MQVTKKNIDELNAILKLEVKKEDFEPKIIDSLKQYRKQADMKGFRKGQVPMSVLKKMHGNSILMDTINNLLSDEVNNFIKENKLNVLGHPIPKEGQTFNMEINSIKDFQFEYELGLAPEFKLDYLDKKPTFERELPKIDKKIIDEEVNRMQLQLGTLESVESINDDKDMLSVKFDELKDGKVLENGISNTSSISLEMVSNEKLAKSFKKLKKGDKIDLDIFNSFSQDEEGVAKHLLGVAKKNVLNNSFAMTIEEIKRTKPAEINEEFLLKVDPKGTLKNVEDLRKKIEAEISIHFDKQADNKMFNKVYETLIEKTVLDLPDTFLKKWIKLTNEKPISDEHVEEEYPSFRKNLIWSLIVKNIKEEGNIEISNEDIKNKTADGIKQQFAQYGMQDFGGEEMEKFVQNMMEREDHINQTKDAILEEKIFSYLKSRINIKDKNVSLEEFNKQK